MPFNVIPCVQRAVRDSAWYFTRRFQCLLVSDRHESVLRVVETNDFKQLAHISLIFQPGSDTAVREVRPFLPPSCFWRPSNFMHLPKH